MYEKAIESHSYDEAVGWWDGAMVQHEITLRPHGECHSHSQSRVTCPRTEYTIVRGLDTGTVHAFHRPTETVHLRRPRSDLRDIGTLRHTLAPANMFLQLSPTSTKACGPECVQIVVA